MQAEIEEGDDGPEAVQRARGLRAANEAEDHLGPVGVVELERHAGDDQQQEAGHHQEMQEAIERREARKPFLAFLGLDLGFAKGLRVVQIELNWSGTARRSVCSAEEDEHAHQQRGHAQESR